jgi:hypothetical protein
MRNLALLLVVLVCLLSACAGPRLVSPSDTAQLPEARVVKAEPAAPALPRDILCDT